ncbi:MAG: YncE family protein, partial [Sandaracinobacteroides sp.]
MPGAGLKLMRAAGLSGLLAAVMFAGQLSAQAVPPPPAEVPPPPALPVQPAPPVQPDHEPYTPTGELDLARLETADLRLLYFDPAQSYLAPYVARSFLNSLAFQKRMFDWKPWDKTTVLLKDFSDFGNAGARSSPNNAILIDVAPLSQTFETFSAGERFFTLMNHEAVHVAHLDVWNSRDATWRRIFGGKPMPIQEHPETILYNFLATPRVNVPRWYLEGAAVFMETWMAGGFGRAQGGYDEMVFRAMVRDDARFFSPLGLESQGTAIDFQVGVNDYLYGTRFFSYLALSRSPEKVLEWLKRGEDSKGYYSAQFKHVFGEPLDQVWEQWIAWEKGFQAKNLASLGKHPLTPVERLSPRALGSVSRLYQDAQGNFVGAFRYPGVIGHVGVLSAADGKVRHLEDVKGAMLYRVTSLAFDPDTSTAFYTSDNYSFRNIIAIDTKTGKSSTLVKQGRIGDIVLNPADKSLWGLRHLNGFVTLVRLEQPYSTWTQIHTFPYGRIPYDLDISPDGTLISASMGEVNGD